MKEVQVQSWDEFQEKVKEIETFRDQVHRSKSHGTRPPDLLFRGQQNACWHLETTLERQVRGDLALSPNAPVDFPAADYLHTIYCIKDEVEIRTGRNWCTALHSGVDVGAERRRGERWRKTRGARKSAA
jgi:hypothetical protein